MFSQPTEKIELIQFETITDTTSSGTSCLRSYKKLRRKRRNRRIVGKDDEKIHG